MELIEIIRTSLIIFTVISTVVFAVSYTVYKVRHRKTTRGYVKSNEFVPAVVVLKTADNTEISEPEIKKQSPRFQVLNDSLKSETVTQSTSPLHKLRQKPVISYYSFNNNEPLHKFRTARVSVE